MYVEADAKIVDCRRGVYLQIETREWRHGLKFGERNLKFLFSKIVKGEANICCAKNRYFKLSEYINNFFYLGVPPLTFYQNKSAILSIF